MAEDYKPNSHKFREEQEQKEREEVKPVAKGEVIVKKEPIRRKFADVFLSDSIGNVKEYLFFDVLIPAVKDVFVDLISNGTNMLVYGSSNGRRSSNKGSNTRTNYSSYSRGNGSNGANRASDGPSVRSRHGYLDIVFKNRDDALEVMDCLNEVLEKYHMVTVAEFYEFSNVPERIKYTDRDYGWYDLSNMKIMRDRDGYRIDLPKAEPLD